MSDESLRILVVDDNGAWLAALEDLYLPLVGGRGCTDHRNVVSTTKGLQAVKKLEKQRFDVLSLDLALDTTHRPSADGRRAMGAHGIDVLAAALDPANQKWISIVLLTASDWTEELDPVWRRTYGELITERDRTLKDLLDRVLGPDRWHARRKPAAAAENRAETDPFLTELRRTITRPFLEELCGKPEVELDYPPKTCLVLGLKDHEYERGLKNPATVAWEVENDFGPAASDPWDPASWTRRGRDHDPNMPWAVPVRRGARRTLEQIAEYPSPGEGRFDALRLVSELMAMRPHAGLFVFPKPKSVGKGSVGEWLSDFHLTNAPLTLLTTMAVRLASGQRNPADDEKKTANSVRATRVRDALEATFPDIEPTALLPRGWDEHGNYRLKLIMPVFVTSRSTLKNLQRRGR